MATKPKIALHPDATVSFPSKGYILDDNGQRITNDHSSYVDVDGQGHWLHNEKHSFTGNEVRMTYSHAVDNSLVDPIDDNEEVGTQKADAPITRLNQGASGNKAETYKKDEAKREKELELRNED
jgi:hypothetical protein